LKAIHRLSLNICFHCQTTINTQSFSLKLEVGNALGSKLFMAEKYITQKEERRGIRNRNASVMLHCVILFSFPYCTAEKYCFWLQLFCFSFVYVSSYRHRLPHLIPHFSEAK